MKKTKIGERRIDYDAAAPSDEWIKYLVHAFQQTIMAHMENALYTIAENINWDNNTRLAVPGTSLLKVAKDLARKGETSSLFARKQLLFRDYLRARPGTAREYGERKAALSRRSSSVSTFTYANSNFINQLMNLAIKSLSALKSK